MAWTKVSDKLPEFNTDIVLRLPSEQNFVGRLVSISSDHKIWRVPDYQCGVVTQLNFDEIEYWHEVARIEE